MVDIYQAHDMRGIILNALRVLSDVICNVTLWDRHHCNPHFTDEVIVTQSVPSRDCTASRRRNHDLISV